MIRGGIYNEGDLPIPPSGTNWTNPTTIQSYPGETAEIRPTAANVAAWHIVTHNYIVFDRLVFNGINHFRNRAAMVGYAAYKGVPSPSAAILGSGLWLLVSGLSVVLGIRPQIGALMIAVFLLVVTPKMHDFWTATDPQHRMGEFINFTKNYAMMGAALMMLALPRPWPYSL